ncbi:XRE family transcriptional regulator [Flavobacterium lindanitolerans]|uniref:DNA-binding XRE family transcriptional regulator n=1 Tax=Flavobacterium lindanitolerans TaxID=428988 RepID=A0A497U866_9FLAO|nr:LexA family transcriptional regulator [Flavobacterium lindanitolerans]MBC8644632.1 LexA family transcriptional regulator [Flavobacterium lindanitolerans]PKW20463.1 DNA-binding XRE family transcriptional regulator [Flavobacterium lindanitolerans]RLJ23906.1 DNA-binding XRE family transcriptional regulator [Flavobacterium lindanitolerans]
MSILSENLRYLRAQRGLSQQRVADDLILTRARYSKYEEAAAEPPLEVLLRISRYFQISIDLILSLDVRKVPTGDLLKLENNRLLLPIKVDGGGENYIEVVTQKVKAGYLEGYADPEYIEGLEHISLPFLRHGKFRAFPISGDSMPPHRDGSLIVGQYLESLNEITESKSYILLTRNEGIVYKRIKRDGEGRLVLYSDNDFYKPYPINPEDIIEVWSYAASITTHEFEPEDLSPQKIREMFEQIRNEIIEIRKK